MEYPRNKQSDTKLKIAIGILAALTTILGILFWREHQQKKALSDQIEIKTQEVVSTATKLDSISRQLTSKIAEVKQLGGDVADLEAIKTQLEGDKAALKNLNNFSMKQYEQKIKDYVVMLKQKDVEILRLRTANGQLTARNDSLSKENESLIEGIEYAKRILSDTVSHVSSKTEEQNNRLRQLEEQNKDLSEKVTAAAALRAENINVYAISQKGNESEGGVYKSKKVDKVRVTFYLQENGLTKKETKDVYMRIMDQRGATIADMQTGSGSFTYRGKDVIYTAKQRINYADTHQMVEFIYSRGVAYQPGKHIVELYSEGFRIGETVFEVK